MYGLNRVQLIGHLGGDPEVRYTASQDSVCSFNVATNESYKGQDGRLVEKTEWHRCVAWRKVAEILGQYLHKGSKVYLEGKLTTRSWEDKDGNKRYQTEIVVSDFVFLDSKESGGRDFSPRNSTESMPETPKTPDVAPDDDLPF